MKKKMSTKTHAKIYCLYLTQCIYNNANNSLPSNNYMTSDIMCKMSIAMTNTKKYPLIPLTCSILDTRVRAWRYLELAVLDFIKHLK